MEPPRGWPAALVASSSQAVADDVLRGLSHFPFLQTFRSNGRFNLWGGPAFSGHVEAEDKLSHHRHHIIISYSFIITRVLLQGAAATSFQLMLLTGGDDAAH